MILFTFAPDQTFKPVATQKTFPEAGDTDVSYSSNELTPNDNMDQPTSSSSKKIAKASKSPVEKKPGKRAAKPVNSEAPQDAQPVAGIENSEIQSPKNAKVSAPKKTAEKKVTVNKTITKDAENSVEPVAKPTKKRTPSKKKAISEDTAADVTLMAPVSEVNIEPLNEISAKSNIEIESDPLVEAAVTGENNPVETNDEPLNELTTQSYTEQPEAAQITAEENNPVETNDEPLNELTAQSYTEAEAEPLTESTIAEEDSSVETNIEPLNEITAQNNTETLAEPLTENSITEENSFVSSTDVETEASDTTTLSITFRLKFGTRYGENLYLSGNHPLLGDNDLSKAVLMNYLDSETWGATLDIPKSSGKIIYKYLFQYSAHNPAIEFSEEKFLNLSDIQAGEVLLIDTWHPEGFFENIFNEEALARENTGDKSTQSTFTHTFKIKAPLLPKNYAVCLLGDKTELGAWHTDKALVLSRDVNENAWKISVDLSGAAFPIQYNYGIFDVAKNEFVQAEARDPRIAKDSAEAGKLIVLADGFVPLADLSFRVSEILLQREPEAAL